MNNFYEEPSADMRVAAKAMRQMFIGLQQEGFTLKETMEFINMFIVANKDTS